VGLGDLQAVADGEYLNVGFKVLNAPGATYKVTIKDTNGSVVQEIPGVVSGLGSVSEEVVKYKVPAAGKYTIEVTAKDIYENTAKVTTAISLDLLKITIVPESTFMIVKQVPPQAYLWLSKVLRRRNGQPKQNHCRERTGQINCCES